MICISPLISSDSTPSNALFPTDVRDEGSEIDVNDEHPLNAFSSIEVISHINVTDSKNVQS